VDNDLVVVGHSSPRRRRKGSTIILPGEGELLLNMGGWLPGRECGAIVDRSSK
jgi:hypothetical protein